MPLCHQDNRTPSPARTQGRAGAAYGMAVRRVAGAVLVAWVASSPAATLAQSRAEQVVVSVIDRHIDLCGQAMRDPEAFLNALPSLFPAGTYGTRTSPDGRLFRLTISTGSGQFSTKYSRYLFEDRGHENCATYFISTEPFAPDEATAADTFQTVAAARFGASNLRGGQLPELYATYNGGTDVLEENPLNFEFLTRKVLPGGDNLTSSHVTNTYISLVTHRDLEREGG